MFRISISLLKKYYVSSISLLKKYYGLQFFIVGSLNSISLFCFLSSLFLFTFLYVFFWFFLYKSLFANFLDLRIWLEVLVFLHEKAVSHAVSFHSLWICYCWITDIPFLLHFAVFLGLLFILLFSSWLYKEDWGVGSRTKLCRRSLLPKVVSLHNLPFNHFNWHRGMIKS